VTSSGGQCLSSLGALVTWPSSAIGNINGEPANGVSQLMAAAAWRIEKMTAMSSMKLALGNGYQASLWREMKCRLAKSPADLQRDRKACRWRNLAKAQLAGAASAEMSKHCCGWPSSAGAA